MGIPTYLGRVEYLGIDHLAAMTFEDANQLINPFLSIKAIFMVSNLIQAWLTYIN